MKKVCSLICLALVLLSMALPASAQETAKTEDSVTISEDVLTCLDMQNIDTVFCVYLFYDGYASFVTYGDIDAVLANVSEPQLQRYYFVRNNLGETATYTYDGGQLTDTEYPFGLISGWFTRHDERAGTIIKNVAADIVVENIYYLRFYDYNAIYYKTDLGDYVYCGFGKNGYLMGLEQFLDLQTEMRYICLRAKDMQFVTERPDNLHLRMLYADMSSYDFSSPDFDPNAPFDINGNPGKFIAISFVVLLAALIVCRVLVRNRRKTRNEDISVNRL